MRTVGIRDLKNNLSRYLRGLKPGQTISITDRGRVVAELRSPRPEGHGILSGRYRSLVESGVIQPAQEAGDPLADWPPPGIVKLPRGTAQALIDEDRGE